MVHINLIWSTTPEGYIGFKNNLIYSCKEDLNYFKSITTGNGKNAVVMGRKTFESIGSKPLPNRLNIVLSKDENFGFNTNLEDKLQDLHLSRNINDVLKTCEEHNIDELWVIGGKEIYNQFIDLADMLVITKYDNYCNFPPEQCIQFLPDISQFESYYFISKSDIDLKTGITLTFTIEHYWRTK